MRKEVIDRLNLVGLPSASSDENPTMLGVTREGDVVKMENGSPIKVFKGDQDTNEITIPQNCRILAVILDATEGNPFSTGIELMDSSQVFATCGATDESSVVFNVGLYKAKDYILNDTQTLPNTKYDITVIAIDLTYGKTQNS